MGGPSLGLLEGGPSSIDGGPRGGPLDIGGPSLGRFDGSPSSREGGPLLTGLSSSMGGPLLMGRSSLGGPRGGPRGLSSLGPMDLGGPLDRAPS